MNAPPGRRSPGQAPRATATSTQQADEANAHSATDLGQNPEGALFEVVSSVGAYGSKNYVFTETSPPYVRGPGRRTTSGPRDAAAPLWWWSAAERIVLDVVNAGGTICSDDLHDAFPEEPSASGAAFGALFARLARAGRLVEVGMVRSRRPEARRRRIILWAAPDGAE